jgi:hypothetical protein
MIVKMLTHSHMTRSFGGVSTFAKAVEFERDLGVFEELKRLFSTTPEVGKETEANRGHRVDRTLDRTRSLFDRTRPVSVQRLRVFLFLIGRGGASGHCRSDTSGRLGSLLDSNRTLALWRPVNSTVRSVAVSLCAAQD